MRSHREKVLGYYQRLESRLGYRYLTGETKHFGYYPDGRDNISEREAQQYMSDLVGQKLSLQRGQSVLDAGCGYGVTGCYLAHRYGVEITGIDLNLYEIAQAQGKAKKRGLENSAHFSVLDYAKLDFRKNNFDAIYTLETLSHAPDLKTTLKGFHRVLRRDGKIALFEYTLAPESSFNQHELEMLNIGINGTAAFGLREFRHDQFPNYLQQVGFKNVAEQNITHHMLPSLARLRRFAIAPYFLIKHLNLQKHFINTTIAVEWYTLVKKDLIRYCIFTATK